MNWAAPRTKAGGLLLVNLTAAKPREAAMVLRWRNAPGVRRWMYSQKKITPAEHMAFRRRLKTDPENAYWLAKRRDGWLGVIYLNRFDRAAGRAYLGVYANPESDRPGKGDALMGALTDLAFRGLGLKVLRLEVFTSNLKAVRFYGRWGFRAERLLRARIRRGSGMMDVRVMRLRKKDLVNGN